MGAHSGEASGFQKALGRLRPRRDLGVQHVEAELAGMGGHGVDQEPSDAAPAVAGVNAASEHASAYRLLRHHEEIAR